MPLLKSFASYSLQMLLALALFSSAADASTDKSIDITTLGISGDGITLNTDNIQRGIDACSAAGGGTLSFPQGRYLTGTIQIKSNVTLRFEKNATLLGSVEASDYRNLDPFIDGSGNPLGHALIIAVDADHVGVVGMGTVDGQGPRLKSKQHPYTIRPFLIRWVRCSNVTVRDIRLVNPGAWTLNFYQTQGALIENLTIRSRDLGIHNNDGINIDSSANIRVRQCDIISGDDALVIKSTSSDHPSHDIIADECKLSSHTNAIKLGTESIGGFKNITISKCDITKTDMAGIALYTVDGGNLHHVLIHDINMNGVAVPISIRRGSRMNAFRQGDKPKQAPGLLRDVTIRNVSAKNIGMIGILINGIPNYPVEAITLENIQLELPGGGNAEDAKIQLPEKERAYPEFAMFGKSMPAHAMYIRHARAVKCLNLQTALTHPDERPASVLIDVQDINAADFLKTSPIGNPH